MNLKGKQTYKASPQQIWDILMNTEQLAKITPGVSKLEQTSEDEYIAISDVKIGPVKGSFKGNLILSEKKEPSAFTLHVKQKSKIGNADATVNILLNEVDGGQCELSFDGKAKLSGTLARTGQRVLSGVANSLTKQFFKGLEEEIGTLATEPTESKPEAVVKEPAVAKNEAIEKATPPPPKPAEESKGLFASILAWIRRVFFGEK